MKKVLYLIIIFAVNLSFGQDYSNVIKTYLQQNRSNFSLGQQDVSDISIASQSFSKNMKVHNVYVEQRYQGIKVFNSTSSFVMKDGAVYSAKLSFTENIAAKANTVSPAINAVNAISKAAAALGLPNPSDLSLLETVGDNSYIFSNGNISQNNIPVELVFQKMEDSQALKLAWDLSIYLLDSSHYYSMRIDALTGELLETHDWVVSCTFGEGSHSHSSTESILFSHKSSGSSSQMLGDGSTYRVFGLPLIGPNEGEDQIVSDPSDPIASPYGWHDTDGEAGPEYTYTRGNNVISQEDANGNNGNGARAEGGASLAFDFPFNLPQAPASFRDAAITNLFYMNNMIHDIMYQYGFDEESGNFQINNYDRGGQGADYVFADAQDGSGLNNANFGTPPDGSAPRMQMYLWSAPGKVLGTLMTINNGPLAGTYYAIESNFVGGTPLPTTAITEDMVVVDDNAGADPNDGCDTIINAAEINGKIAIVRAGGCGFTFKVAQIQAAGAIAVVVVNNQPTDPISMTGGGSTLDIPSIMIYQTDGEAIITALQNGDTVNASLRDDGSGNDPFQRDGDLDNVVVAHEYGHGISNRLTGGPANVNCLQNEEQMGEGWSDYFGLILTMKAEDTDDYPRGIGNYALGEGVNGRGLRAKHYTTDFALNNFTYNSIKTQVAPHGVGSVWTTMLWDLTWDLIDEYGFDPDIYHGSGGNNIALQLVMDGLKLQACSPGFVDGRDAILEADEIANGGANRCIIWNAFAKRGLGLSAIQGSSNSRFDGTEAFDVPADCVLGNSNNEIKTSFIIYPNPSNGEINIKSRVDVGEASISIFDMNGRKVFSQNIELHRSANINASNLRTGIYLMQIEGGGRSQTTKLIIN